MERLIDLRHDLGKHLRLPLTMLPAGASAADVRRALELSLHQTRRRGGRALPARELWRAFSLELSPTLGHLAEWQALERVVERALSWEGALTDNVLLDRDEAEHDLRAVGEAIELLIEAVDGAA